MRNARESKAVLYALERLGALPELPPSAVGLVRLQSGTSICSG